MKVTVAAGSLGQGLHVVSRAVSSRTTLPILNNVLMQTSDQGLQLTATNLEIGIRQMIGNGDTQTEWHIVMATALLAILPPVMVVLLMQRWFVRGLVEAEK
jgi:DNA polymerase III sliding clamp (beta) subunit (PCNA family)